MKHRDEKELEENIAKILSAPQESVEKLPDGLIKDEIKKIRSMPE